MLKKFTKNLFRKLGFRISKLTKNKLVDSEDGFSGIYALMKEEDRRGVFFDVGANTGQTLKTMKQYFPGGTIHSFEPGKPAFEKLQLAVTSANIHAHNIAFGAREEQRQFNENNFSDMSSFLPLGAHGWGEVIDQPRVKIYTIDNFCAQHGISKINVLKSDTQGYELEVLAGATEMLKANKIQFIYLEINFVELYKDIPSFCDIYNFLIPFGYKLMRFYDFNYYEGSLGWGDALFFNPAFQQNS